MDDQTKREENIGKIIMGMFAVFAAIGIITFLSIIPGILPFIGLVAIVTFIVTSLGKRKKEKVKEVEAEEVN